MGISNKKINGIYITVMRDGSQLNNDNQEKLIAPITKKEIEDSLQEIDDLKSSGIDGYGACFFKKTQNIVNADVLRVIHDFFYNGRLYKAANYTFATLIPKSKYAKRIKDYRPISCFSIIYKIISKVLTKRMGKIYWIKSNM